jgi:SAM-dependent methyltransferase
MGRFLVFLSRRRSPAHEMGWYGARTRDPANEPGLPPPEAAGHCDRIGASPVAWSQPGNVRPVKMSIRYVRERIAVRLNPFQVFLTTEAMAINSARQQHLASLGLPLAGKDVLEVGAGIGLHTAFFEEQRCKVLATDGRPDNVAEMRRLHPERTVSVLDLEQPDDIRRLGHFDVAYCYGTLYHLGTPEATLQALADVSAMILLETCCTPGDEPLLHMVSEQEEVRNQAKSSVGCRPTRSWVLGQLTTLWGHGYVSLTQPDYGEFPLDWSQLPAEPHATHNTRAVFVGSRESLDDNGLLSTTVPSHQRRAVGSKD